MRKFMFVAGVVLAGSASASAPVAVFSGDFRISGVAPHAFDVLVRVGDTQCIEMEKGYVLELEASSFNKSIARIKASPFVPRKDAVRGFVLHESTAIGAVSERSSFTYQVCDEGVLFVSPVRDDLPGC